MSEQTFKRHTAYKLRIGSIISGKTNLESENKLKFVEIENKQVMRVNIIGNVIEKYIQEGEKKYGSITLDDGSGQIKAKVFGDDIEKISPLNQGDTLLVIGLLRFWSNEIYITPEIMKTKDPAYLLVRKLEIEAEQPKTLEKAELAMLKDKIMTMIKESETNGGIDIEKMILDLHEPPEIINNEIKKLLEDGVIYEPRPGKLRYLG